MCRESSTLILTILLLVIAVTGAVVMVVVFKSMDNKFYKTFDQESILVTPFTAL